MAKQIKTGTEDRATMINVGACRFRTEAAAATAIVGRLKFDEAVAGKSGDEQVAALNKFFGIKSA